VQNDIYNRNEILVIHTYDKSTKTLRVRNIFSYFNSLGVYQGSKIVEKSLSKFVEGSSDPPELQLDSSATFRFNFIKDPDIYYSDAIELGNSGNIYRFFGYHPAKLSDLEIDEVISTYNLIQPYDSYDITQLKYANSAILSSQGIGYRVESTNVTGQADGLSSPIIINFKEPSSLFIDDMISNDSSTENLEYDLTHTYGSSNPTKIKLMTGLRYRLNWSNVDPISAGVFDAYMAATSYASGNIFNVAWSTNPTIKIKQQLPYGSFESNSVDMKGTTKYIEFVINPSTIRIEIIVEYELRYENENIYSPGTGDGITITESKTLTRVISYNTNAFVSNVSTKYGDEWLLVNADGIRYFYGNVELKVTKDFDKASVACFHHGYMGGEELLRYDSGANNGRSS
tara:strand:- start:678 stop:1874 length:1197 start_codon:yes stop_codon:yes gene_type:complete